MKKTEAQRNIIRDITARRVAKLLDETLEEIVEELKEANFGGDCYIGALEVVGSIAATVTRNIEKVVNSSKGMIVQQKPLSKKLSN